MKAIQELFNDGIFRSFWREHFSGTDVKACFDDNPDLIIEVDGMRIGVEHT